MSNVHSERAHALLSASGAERWMECTPSARMEEEFPEESSPYAEEGTLAHEYAEAYIKSATNAERQEVLNLEFNRVRTSKWYNEDFEMHVQSYVSYVLSLMQYAKDVDPNAVILTEKRLDFSYFVKEGFGTGDFCAIAAQRGVVADLKFGKGVKKYAENNPQLMIYALGLLKEYEHLNILTFTLVIFQPRIEHIDTWEISREDLLAWATTYLMPKARLAYEGKGELRVGTWCKFCKVKATCKGTYNAFKDLDAKRSKNDFSNDAIAYVLDVGAAISSYIASVTALATERALNGNPPSGYKVVAGKSSRKFTDVKQVEERLILSGFPAHVIYNKELKSLTDIQKALGLKAFNAGLEDLITRSNAPKKLVPISDKRPAITLADDFNDLSEGFDDLDAYDGDDD